MMTIQQKQQVIYLAAPNSVRPTPRYEKYYHLIAEHFPGAEIIEACEEFADPTPPTQWKKRFTELLQRIDMLIFLRNEVKCVGKGTWTEIIQAHNAGKAVYLACTNRDDELVLVAWDDMTYSIKEDQKRNYARFASKLGQAQAEDERTDLTHLRHAITNAFASNRTTARDVQA